MYGGQPYQPLYPTSSQSPPPLQAPVPQYSSSRVLQAAAGSDGTPHSAGTSAGGFGFGFGGSSPAPSSTSGSAAAHGGATGFGAQHQYYGGQHQQQSQQQQQQQQHSQQQYTQPGFGQYDQFGGAQSQSQSQFQQSQFQSFQQPQHQQAFHSSSGFAVDQQAGGFGQQSMFGQPQTQHHPFQFGGGGGGGGGGNAGSSTGGFGFMGSAKAGPGQEQATMHGAGAAAGGAGGNAAGGQAFFGSTFINDLQGSAAGQIGMQLGSQAFAQVQQNVNQNLNQYVNITKLRYYFNVSNSYVLNKLRLLLFPFRHSSWSRLVRRSQHNGQLEGYAPPREDLNAPDLYIPERISRAEQHLAVMAYMTYILITAFRAGMGSAGSNKSFSPEVLGIVASKAFFLIVAEVLLLKMSFYLLSITNDAGFTDLTAYCGYKFIIVNCLLVIKYVATDAWSLWFVVPALYLILSFGFFTLRTMRYLVLPDQSTNNVVGREGRKRRVLSLFATTSLQCLAILWLI
ncbi:Protein transport protein yif1 [Polyrhizophydium stewartii]|uniref:Protein transport protein yif1 n=1 Tax=Polyrhizophydium stewartii TaxID=2732419 RepID=A0ABR4NEI9_9FUNG